MACERSQTQINRVWPSSDGNWSRIVAQWCSTAPQQVVGARSGLHGAFSRQVFDQCFATFAAVPGSVLEKSRQRWLNLPQLWWTSGEVWSRARARSFEDTYAPRSLASDLAGSSDSGHFWPTVGRSRSERRRFGDCMAWSSELLRSVERGGGLPKARRLRQSRGRRSCWQVFFHRLPLVISARLGVRLAVRPLSQRGTSMYTCRWACAWALARDAFWNPGRVPARPRKDDAHRHRRPGPLWRGVAGVGLRGGSPRGPCGFGVAGLHGMTGIVGGG